MDKLVVSLVGLFLRDNFAQLRFKLESCGEKYGSLFVAQVAVQVGEYLRLHCVSTVYEAWVRHMWQDRDVRLGAGFDHEKTLVGSTVTKEILDATSSVLDLSLEAQSEEGV
jgi:hypothetical protein